MNKDEFLRRLEEALSGEVPASVIRDNPELLRGLSFPGVGKRPYHG